MKKIYFPLIFSTFTLLSVLQLNGQSGSDSITIYNLGHASLMFEYKQLVIHVDPTSTKADYTGLPKADLFLITHQHSDHYDVNTLNSLKKDSTIMVYTQTVADLATYNDTAFVMNNGDSINIKGIAIKAFPAYNISTTYHVIGIGNGYVMTLGEKNIYIAGDTEKIPAMDSLGKIDIAFLPMNLPYTMTPEMAAEAAICIQPDVLYIYHFGTSDTAHLRSLLVEENMEIRMGYSIFSESSEREEQTAIMPYENDRLHIYPVPVRDYLTFSYVPEGSLVLLYDFQGQLLYKNIVLNDGEYNLDLRQIQAGGYIIRLQNKEEGRQSVILKQ